MASLATGMSQRKIPVVVPLERWRSSLPGFLALVL